MNVTGQNTKTKLLQKKVIPSAASSCAVSSDLEVLDIPVHFSALREAFLRPLKQVASYKSPCLTISLRAILFC